MKSDLGFMFHDYYGWDESKYQANEDASAAKVQEFLDNGELWLPRRKADNSDAPSSKTPDSSNPRDQIIGVMAMSFNSSP